MAIARIGAHVSVVSVRGLLVLIIPERPLDVSCIIVYVQLSQRVGERVIAPLPKAVQVHATPIRVTHVGKVSQRRGRRVGVQVAQP